MTSKWIPQNTRQMAATRPTMPDLSLATDIVCESCNNLTFEEVLVMKKFSPLADPNGRGRIVPIPTFACVACGHVNEMFRPNSAITPPEPDAPTESRSSLLLEK